MTSSPIGGTTQLVGILGWPVDHSLSPRMHNAAFAATGFDWAYIPLPTAPDRLGEAVGGLAATGFAGANVTIPHKVDVMGFCDDVDDVAGLAGSVNTLVFDDGRVYGSSTDGRGVDRVEAKGRRILLGGAGGAARPVACALLGRGAVELTLAARRGEAARSLAADLQERFPEVSIGATESWPPTGDADVIVNATPVKDAVMVELRPDQQVVDLAYRADRTPTAMVERARELGCEIVIDGLEFLLRQGAASFELWTGREAPIEPMRDALRMI